VTTRVIDLRAVGWLLGLFVGALAVCLLIPLFYAYEFDPASIRPFSQALIVVGSAAFILLAACYRRERLELNHREAILLVTLAWLAISAGGALPLYFSPWFEGYSAAFFEAASGFTTTGATVLAQMEGVAPTIHLWRCLSHWLGGMGIVLLGIAILPIIGQGGMLLYRAEFSGARSQRLKPRLAETVLSFWWIYVAYTAFLTIGLYAAGMSAFEAVCHAFSTMGTGGFSTRTESIGAFSSPAIEYLSIVFMLLAGFSFVQHYHLLVERRVGAVFRDQELRTYLLIFAVASFVILPLRLLDGDQPEAALRSAMFQTASILTTTGFVTDDFGLWHPLSQLLLVFLMFAGGCTGSTAGGLKVARIVLLVGVIRRELRRIVEPHGVFGLRLAGEVMSEQTVSALLNLVYMAALVLITACLLVAATGVDILSTVSAVIACTFNVGPGLGAVGPSGSYGQLPSFAQWVLALCMIAGRLEFYTFLVIFTRPFWRR